MANGTTDPCALLAQAQLQYLALVNGQAVVAVETPQLGRVEYNKADINQLRMVIDQLRGDCAASQGMRVMRRRPISVDTCV